MGNDAFRYPPWSKKNLSMRHSTLTIQKAVRMRKMGFTFKEIFKATGVSATAVMWHSNPEYRAKQEARGERWRKNNPERWREIVRKAVDKFNKVHGKT